MLSPVAVVRTDVSEKGTASIIRVVRTGKLGTSNQSMLQEEMLHIVILRSLLQLLFTANVVPSSQILVSLMMEVTCSSETLVLTTAMRLNIPENGVLPV
jgi:hypothetical protein